MGVPNSIYLVFPIKGENGTTTGVPFLRGWGCFCHGSKTEPPRGTAAFFFARPKAKPSMQTLCPFVGN